MTSFARMNIRASTLVLVLAAGCGSESEPIELPAVKLSPSMLRGSAAPEHVEVIGEEPGLPYVEVRTEDGHRYHVHRNFIDREGDSEQAVLLSAAEVYDKPKNEEFYFSLEELRDLRRKVPVLFRTSPSGYEVLLPWKTRYPVEYKGELAYPVMECFRPECPGRNDVEEGEPVLFTRAPANVPTVAERKRLKRGEPPQSPPRSQDEAITPIRTAADLEGTQIPFICPHCRAAGRPADRREAIRQQIRPHVPPEAADMLDMLEAEHRRSREVRARKFNPPVGPTAGDQLQ